MKAMKMKAIHVAMKRIKTMKMFFVALVAILLSFFSTIPCFAAGTVVAGTPSWFVIGGQRQRLVLPITCTADALNATYPTLAIDPATYGIKGWYLWLVETDPGTTGPTNGAWDLDITNAHGFLESQNLIDDRSSTATQQVRGVTLGYPQILNTWTLSLADNAVNSAVVVVYFTFTAN